MTIASQVQNVNNYMVPAAGQTHAVTIAGVFSATPYAVDWRQFHLDNFPFIPQGVFVDNTQGTAALVISIQPVGYNVVCPAGTAIQAQFPAPSGQTCSITGNGQASCFFVDFPVLPSGQNVNINGTANVNIASGNNAASPVSVIAPPNSQGLPYQVQKIVFGATAKYLSLGAGVSSVNLAPPANSNLRRMKLTVSGNATLAAAANDLITVTLNAIVLFKVSPYILTTAGTALEYDVDFPDAAPNVGTGNLVLTCATALTAGIIELNAYFD